MTTLPNPKKRRLYLILSIAVLAILLGLWAQHNLHKKQPGLQDFDLAAATVFSQPRAISPFQLVDTEGKPFTQDNLKGHYSLVFFGFTHCPDLCPTTLSILNQAYKNLENQHITPPAIVFISVDPEQDTPPVIKKYLSSFNPAFFGATGTPAQIDQLTKEMSVIYAKVQPTNDSSTYSIDHSGTILIINPQGQFYGVFTLPHDAQKIATDIKTLAATGK